MSTAEGQDVAAVITVDGSLDDEATAREIREIHARYGARGISTRDAYVTAAVTVTRATIDAGADAFVRSCLDLGLVYVLLRWRPSVVPGMSPAGYLAFWRDVVRRVIDVNLAGTLLVEKRLALHLEALQSIDPRRPLENERAEPRSEGCASCAYDPYCDTPLLRRYTMDDEVERALGTDWCKTSMGTFDHVFELLRSPRGKDLRRVFASWMAARNGVAARLTT